MAIRLISWNINSVRARLDIVDTLITEQAPDVIAFQETKVMDDMFPRAFFEERGYVHQALRGQKNHHGVATLSRVPLAGQHKIDWCQKGDARHIAVTLENGIDIHNFYVPAGGDEPDPDTNDKFAHKLQFMAEMKDWSAGLSRPSIAVGDLNVAPLESDVWSHKQLLKVVSHTPVEVAAFEAIMAAHDWVDIVRRDVPEPEKLYSWWSYRARDWEKSDRGRRLDHVWASPAISDKVVNPVILKHSRGWTKPSDHAALQVDIEG